MGVGDILPPPCWFSLNNSETRKAVVMAFCGIQLLFVTGILAKFGIPNSHQSSDFGQNPDSGILVNP